MKNCLPSITLSLIIPDLRYHRSGISIRVRHRAKRPAVRLILHAVFDHLGFRVVEKIVSWLRFSLSQSPFFARDLEQNFAPNFCKTFYVGQPSFLFTRWLTQPMEREHAKRVLKTRFYSNYLL